MFVMFVVVTVWWSVEHCVCVSAVDKDSILALECWSMLLNFYIFCNHTFSTVCLYIQYTNFLMGINGNRIMVKCRWHPLTLYNIPVILN